MRISKIADLFKFNLGIKYKLLATYLIVIIVPMIIGTYLPFTYTQKRVIEETEESLQLSTRNMVESIKYKLLKYNSLSTKLMSDGEIINLITNDFSGGTEEVEQTTLDVLIKLRKETGNNYDEILNIRIYHDNDAITERGDYILNINNYKNTDWYKGVYGNKGVAYWKHSLVRNFNAPDINAISIIGTINAPSPVGLVEVELRSSEIFNNITQFKYKEDSLAGVIDEHGNTIIANQGKEEIFSATFHHLKESILKEGKESFTQGVGKENYLVISQELNFQGWKLVTVVPLRELYSTANKIRLITLITALSCIVVFLVLTVFFSNLLTSRLQRLARRMSSVEDGNFNVSMVVEGNDEIGQLSRVFNSMVQSIRNLIEEVYKSRIEKKEAELRALQEQINPHFLYNALSSINWLAVQAGAPKIVDTVEALATFYRLSLNKGKETILLRDEISQAKAYVSLQKLRYEDSFEVYFEVEPGLENARIIKFILQPFIENAIIHGLEEEGGSIYITAKSMEENSVLIRIIDNGKGMTQDKVASLLIKETDDRKGGYGIKNVNERIKLHYGDEFGIHITSEPQNGTIVEIKLPYMK